MSSTTLSARRVVLAKVLSLIPLARSTIYKDHSRGRLPWLTREDPEGRRGKVLWVLVDAYDQWAIPRGLQPISSELDLKFGDRRRRKMEVGAEGS